jgi:O-Antigen ligase.
MNRFFQEHTTTYFKGYYLLLILMVISLPLTKALSSIIPGVLMFWWLVDRKFPKKLGLLRQRKGLILIISIYFIYLAGLLWTKSMEWGVLDVTIQLPLLVLPLVIGTSPRLNYIQVKYILYVFALAVVVASFCSIWVLLGLSDITIRDPREMSLFISHIRFSLLINIAIFSLGWYLMNAERKHFPEKLFLILTIIWLAIFLIILRSVTGWVVFFIISLLVVFRNLLRIKKMYFRVSLISVLVILATIPAIYVLHIVHQFYQVEKVSPNLFHEKTAKGNSYLQDTQNKELENGHYIYLYLNEDEIREAWNKRSKLNYDSIYPSGFNRLVLIRYLTSKGLRKDAECVGKLTPNDIKNIENGMTNYRFANSFTFYKRIYQIIWETDSYLKGNDPSGHSVTQRLEYYKMGLKIVAKKPLFGHGTGGYFPAYQEEYNKSKFFTRGEYRQRSHNMLLSYAIDFGLIGMTYICFALVAPVFIENKKRSALLISFLLIVFISFISEDTLNNHDAISFFAFFYPLYLYSDHEKPMIQSNKRQI